MFTAHKRERGRKKKVIVKSLLYVSMHDIITMRTDMQLHLSYKAALSNWMHVQSLLYAFSGIWQKNTPMKFKQDRAGVGVVPLQ